MVMNLEEKWEKALKETKIIRYRLRNLLAFDSTELPYIVLSPSCVNLGDTVVRKGKVIVHRPLIILPYGPFAQFEGFDFEDDFSLTGDDIRRFLLMRGVSFPSLKYKNETYELDIFEGDLEKAITYFSDQLERKEDVYSGLITGPEDAWQFSVLIYVAAMAARSASSDIEQIMEELRRRSKN
ncbi:MAG TPA: hypothetical protein ENL39_01270 [Candidatus Aerophobetes bacterium]|uniref:Uncharacterized protein n=1 Tax=Aerophobetes bacterium TaxID=2030807 RepID=A0A7V5HYC1_UNCAE|nr:hypothetical protein [Candidatus Aerophobetes bacterium]